MLKVLIVDDEPLARENLRILLEAQPDIEIVGECGNAVEAIGAVRSGPQLAAVPHVTRGSTPAF